MADYLDSLYEGVEELFRLETKLEIQGAGMEFEEKEGLQHRVYTYRHWLGEQTTQIREPFARFLDLSGIN